MAKGASIIVGPRFLKRAGELDKAIRAKLVRVLSLLAMDLRHPSLQCKPVQGARHRVYECRVDEGVRLIYDVVRGHLRCCYVGEHDAALRFAEGYLPIADEDDVDDVDDVEMEPDLGVQDSKLSELSREADSEERILEVAVIESLLMRDL